MFTDGEINKMSHRHTIKCYSALKRRENMVHPTTQIKLEGIMQHKMNQSKKKKKEDKYCLIHLSELSGVVRFI